MLDSKPPKYEVIFSSEDAKGADGWV